MSRVHSYAALSARLLACFILTAVLAASLSVSGSHAQCPSNGAFGTAILTTNPLLGSWACAAGDIDGDGFDDAAFLGEGSRLLIKMGAPSIDQGAEYVFPRTDAALGLALRDLNGDGVLDVVYLNGSALGVMFARVTDGAWQHTFANPVFSPTVAGPRRLAIADLDGDGRLDAVVGSVGTDIALHIGLADGSFSTGQTIGLGSNPFSVTIADLNQDGRGDIVAAGLSGDVWVLLGSGSPGSITFAPPAHYRAFIEPLAVAVADFNNDGVLDIACSDDPGRAALFLGRLVGGVPNGTFADAIGVPVGANVPYGFAAADIDGDGNVDLLTGNNDGNVSLVRGHGDGTFSVAELYSTNASGTDIAVADMNHDSAPDLIVGGATAGLILPGSCPHLPQQPVIASFTPTGGAPGDHVTIFGAFISRLTSVSIGGTECQVLSGTNYPVVAVVPANATTGPIQIQTEGGLATSRINFVVGPHPVLTDFTPMSARPGQIVTVHGDHLAAATFCSIGGTTSAPFIVVSDQQLDLTVNGAAADGPIHVRTPTGEALTTLSFTVLPPESAARIVSVRDVRNDQGGRVIIRWTRSEVDDADLRLIRAYRVWRRAPLDPTSPRQALPAATPPPGPGWFWEAIGEVPAAYLQGYSFNAPTYQDSIGTDPGWAAFFVQALNRNDVTFYISNVDSGYSVDNLAPRAPSPLVANYTPTSNQLHWPASAASDFAQFRLYRGTSSSFVPADANLLAATRDTAYRDPAHGAFTYKLIAVDVHGNASRVVSVTPDLPVSTLASLVSAKAFADHADLLWFAEGATGVGAVLYRWSAAQDWTPVEHVYPDGDGYIRYRDAQVLAGATYRYRLGIDDAGSEGFFGEAELSIPLPSVSLRLATSNPILGHDVRCSISLPDDGRAVLELVDIAGRLVAREQLQGPLSKEVSLQPGSAAAGVYLLRLRTGGTEIRRRVVMVP